MFEPLCEINICDIDLTDERYKIAFSEDDITFLALSIKETGLISPPVVRPLDNKFIVISGFNRIRALIRNNETKALVRQTKPDTSDYQCIEMSITLLAFKKPLTHAELIISVNRLYPFLDKEQIAKKSSAIFNTELNVKFVDDLLTIGALPDPALELIHSGNLSLKSAKRISSYEKETIMAFLNIFSKINASSSKQLEIIQYIMEISARDHTRPEAFICNANFQTILLDEHSNPVMKTDQIRAYLYKLRFPTIFKARQMIREKIASINLGHAIKFLPPENFDSQNYSISFTAKNFNDFDTNMKRLNSALDNSVLKEIFNP